MKPVIPDSALADCIAALGHIGELVISSRERLPLWVVLRAWRPLVINGECWEFSGGWPNPNGHRRIEFASRPYYFHRVIYALNNGPIPDGLVVRHTCDNPPCVRPSHLISGTQQQNVDDMHERGRNKNPPTHYGMNNPKATITDTQVVAMRASKDIPLRELAAAFSCSPSTAWRITRGLVRNGAPK